MTPKYDVYCFGGLLFEILCGRKPKITDDGVHEKPDKFINPNLREQTDTKLLMLFEKLSSKCLNQQFVERPTMDQIMKELEDVLDLHLQNANLKELPKAALEGTSSKMVMMDLLTIPLSEIRHTNYFHQENCIGTGGFSDVYKANLEVLDIQSLSSMDEKCKVKPPKIRKTVAIKRLSKTGDEKAKEVFRTEIELLTSCKHPNIISLLGFSKDDGEMILVFEFAFGGSLADYLGSDYKKVSLTWAK